MWEITANLIMYNNSVVHLYKQNCEFAVHLQSKVITIHTHCRLWTSLCHCHSWCLHYLSQTNAHHRLQTGDCLLSSASLSHQMVCPATVQKMWTCIEPETSWSCHSRCPQDTKYRQTHAGSYITEVFLNLSHKSMHYCFKYIIFVN